MPKKVLSSKDLDAQFDAFLKESLSDEEDIKKFLNPKKKEQPWWNKDGSSDEESGSVVKKSFLKPKKGIEKDVKSFLKTSGTADHTAKEDERADLLKPSKTVTPEPTPRPRVRRTGSGDMADTLQTTIGDISMSKDSLEDYPGKSRNEFQKQSTLVETSLEDTTSEIPSERQRPGFDTLDEQADKERFFKELEDQADSTLDYSKLNKKLDMSATTPGDTMIQTRHVSDDEEYSDEFEAEETKPVVEVRDSVETKDSVEAKDSVEEQSSKDNSRTLVSDVKKPSMLSRVSLMESTMDSTLGTRAVRDTGEENEMSHGPEVTSKSVVGTGHGYSDTASQEIAALQRALQEVGMSTLGSTREGPTNTTGNISSINRQESTSSQYRETEEFGMKTMSGHDAGKPPRTVEDILREVEEIERRSQQSMSDTERLTRLGIDTLDHGEGAVKSPKEKSVFDLLPLDDGSDGNHGDELPPSKQQLPPSKQLPKPRQVSHDYHPAKKKSRTKYSDVKSSGYGPRWVPSKHHKQEVSWSPANTIKSKVKGTQVLSRPPASGAATIKESQLTASVQAFAEYIQDHFNTPPSKKTSSAALSRALDEDQIHDRDRPITDEREMKMLERELQLEVKEWQERWQEERKLHAKMKADLFSQEKEHVNRLEEQRLRFEEEILKLKQENFVLAAKVVEDDPGESEYRKGLEKEKGEGEVSKKEHEMLEKTMREQERLIAGYQLENERLYKEMKRIESLQRVTEEKMFKENQRLSAEVTQLRQALDRKETELKSQGIITSPLAQQQFAKGPVGSAVLGAGRITELNVELRQAKAKVDSLEVTISKLEAEKKCLSDQIDHLIHSRERESDRDEYNKAARAQELQEIQQRYEVELDRLNKKLKWYAENQEILDRDNELLKGKNAEIRKLKRYIDTLEKEHGSQVVEQKTKAKQKETDAKQILDLKRQVREMETIIKKRHPNSLPALIWAAGMVPDGQQTTTKTVEFLENRNRKLEQELEEKDEETKRELRAMEQKYTAIKYQYEERINFLEKQLEVETDHRSARPEELTSHPKTSVLALERELDSVRSRFKQEVSDLREEVQRAQQDAERQRSRADAFAQKMSDQKAAQEKKPETSSQVKSLQVSLADKTQEVLSLHTSIERLQGEKQVLMKTIQKLETKVATLSNKLVTKRPPRGSLNQRGDRPAPVPADIETPANQKPYTPDVFTGLHIDDVLKENEHLKVKVDQLELQVTQQRIDVNRTLAEYEASARTAREGHEEELASLRRSHRQEVERLMTEHALHNSSSKMADLMNKVDTQEAVIRHLRDQQVHWESDVEQLSVLRIREAALETQVKNLNEELKEAKTSHTPEMRHFESLLEKIKIMEERHAQRERQLKETIRRSGAPSVYQHPDVEVQKWKELVQRKNEEVNRFRLELDSILSTLRELQRQGVVLPDYRVS